MNLILITFFKIMKTVLISHCHNTSRLSTLSPHIPYNILSMASSTFQFKNSIRANVQCPLYTTGLACISYLLLPSCGKITAG
jgi:hypothetical protein